jgi:single-strand DNA-binding protein
MNIITIAGRLGADPEIRFTSNGKKVTTLRVATNSRRGSKDETIWWRVTVWGDNFDKMISFLKKGDAVIIVGELSKPEVFTDREGKAQVSMNITASNIMFSPFGKIDKTNTSNNQANVETTQGPAIEQNENEYASFTTGAKEENSNHQFSDDEIPF